MFASGTFQTGCGDDDRRRRPATGEGADVLGTGSGAVVVGLGGRTAPQTGELLARRLFADDAAQTVIAVELPKLRAFMHLDTVMTMVDRGTFVASPSVAENMRAWSLTKNGDPEVPKVKEEPSLFGAIRSALEVDELRVLTTGGDSVEAEREQWDDGNNVLAVAPGVVVA